MKQFMLTFICMLQIAILSAQPLIMPIGRNMGIGTYSRHFQDVMTAWTNPAGLSCLPVLTAGVYTESRFLLKAIPLYAAMAAVPVQTGAFGLALARFGNTAYYQQKISGSYGRRLGQKVSIGLQFNYETTAVRGYGTSGIPGFTAGLLWHINEKLHTGLQVMRSAYLPVVYSAGAGFEASPDFLLTAEVINTRVNTACIKAATYYRIVQSLALQLGIASQPPYNNAAVIFHLHALRIDVAASFHPQLGITPSTTLIWQLSSQTVAE
jgi:long-subunit fatty acid transport protein